DEGREVRLAGWVHARRDHGGVYLFAIRDRSGLVQVVARPQDKEVFAAAETLGSEAVISVVGRVSARPPGSENPKLPTGAVEVPARELRVLSVSKPPPFEVSDDAQAGEEVRLRHRYLDLRRPRMLRNLRVRHQAAQAARRHLDAQGFLEVETPILAKSTPEGARTSSCPAG
ncbi:MAG: amino acid--tRNA ligase-related protein, partial [Elusimicrobiota bacterium]